MCFSATASFGAGAILSVIGAASLLKVQARPQLVFAAIPLVFSIQQTAEGFLWLAIPDPDSASVPQFATYTFVFLAQIVWPLLVPAAMLLVEEKENRKKILKFLLAAGLLEALFQVYCLFTYPVQAKIDGHHILYELNHPAIFKYYSGIGYILATMIPPFFSSIKRMWIVGVIIILSSFFTLYFYKNYVVSVWCFFASIISISVYAIMHQLSHEPDKAKSPDLRI